MPWAPAAAKNSGADAVEQLHADQPGRVVRERIERLSKRQDRECSQEELLVAPSVGAGADQ
jgi:hypothetical protein